MVVLGVETSCDETSVALVRDGEDVLASVVASQVDLHAVYGGVVPELAAREHLRAITPVMDTAMAEAGLEAAAIDAVAVTQGPGLIPALLVGNAYAKGFALAKGCPILGVNHFLAHIYGVFLGRSAILAEPTLYPLLALVVSGGHTALVLIESSGHARILGATLDDAAGEAYDKAAKILGLGYPGGPVIDRLARSGSPTTYDFPRALTPGGGKPLSPENRLNFSFSGVKTALLYAVRDRTPSRTELADLAAGYQEAIVQVLVLKTRWAAEESRAPTVCVCGGVACNSRLRTLIRETMQAEGRRLLLAEPRFCTDNAAMVAGLAYHALRRGRPAGSDQAVSARLPIDLGIVPFVPGLDASSPTVQTATNQ
ncbi:MAG: tRNA (adenosine(37)-N6)-threonylcarbamoyltransferase complex transferase subunit TsaD [Lentisphaeria bacterium]|nr:tRNA (adenosine(37)-N6)-threonylcarbamoyltransferase complex transferase subunit TsaD [Lentisphaeria bacterium]